MFTNLPAYSIYVNHKSASPSGPGGGLVRSNAPPEGKESTLMEQEQSLSNVADIVDVEEYSKGGA
jgi:hypothetical protein